MLIRYPTFPTAEETAPKPAEPSDSKDGQSEDKDCTPGTLVLGHVSVVTDIILSPDSRFIITADRDEHIRISNYPLGFVIHTFCLGSTSFVTSLHILPSNPDVLVSGGGEDVLRVWLWKDGKQLRTIDIGEVVRPKITVPPPNIKANKPAKKKRKLDTPEDEPEEPPKVLALTKIDSVGDFILFCVLGATALFHVYLEESVDATEAPLAVTALDLGAPVLDFVVDKEHPDRIWISLDTQEGPLLRSARLDSATGSLLLAPAPSLTDVPEGMHLPLP